MTVSIPARSYLGATSVFVKEYGPTLSGRNIAMGDRASQFAYLYEGNVFQLEGLVSSPDYLETIKNHKDLRQYLCARNVEIVVDYEPRHSRYEYLDLKIFDPSLTSIEGVTLRVYANEEIAVYENPEDWTRSSLIDTVIYAWQLDCTK